MSLYLDCHYHTLSLDRTLTPEWASKIKRWSQLDEASLALAEATHQSLEFFSGGFDQLILTSSQGSFFTDRQFVTDTKLSPSNFVHTLPNVRSVVFSILTEWVGPMYCFSQGEHSLVSFFHEAPLVHAEVLSAVINLNKVGEQFQCDFYLLGKKLKKTMHAIYSMPAPGATSYLVNDFELRELISKKSEVALTNHSGIRKIF